MYSEIPLTRVLGGNDTRPIQMYYINMTEAGHLALTNLFQPFKGSMTELKSEEPSHTIMS